MRQFFYLSVFCVLVLSACTGAFKKGDKGLEYKIFATGSGKTLTTGNYMQIHIKKVYMGTKDSLLQDSRDYMPLIQPFDSTSTPPAYFKILNKVRKGDSLIIRVLVDSIYKNAMEPMPPFMKKGKYIYTHVKVVNIFETQAQADSANKAEMVLGLPRIFKKQMEEIQKEVTKNKPQIDADSKVISEYLAKNNIKADKAPWGTFIAMHTEGTGEKANSESVVSVNYTGRVLDSIKAFDSNVDPAFKHTEPLNVKISALGEIIFGWTDALMQLKKGSKVTLYVPSTLGYGKNGKGEIRPDANLVFDIEVLDIMTEKQLEAKQMAEQNKMMEMQRSMQDSLQKANKK